MARFFLTVTLLATIVALQTPVVPSRKAASPTAAETAFRQRLAEIQLPPVPARLRHASHNNAASPGAVPPTASPRTRELFDKLLLAADLKDAEGRIILNPADVAMALDDMHLQRSEPALAGVQHPADFLPEHLYLDEPVDASVLVEVLSSVLEAHPIFLSMVEETCGNDEWYRSVYFGTSTRDATSLDFAALSRKLVTSIHVFEALLALEHDQRRKLALWYEALLGSASDAEAAAAEAATTAGTPSLRRSPREMLLGFFLAIKGESVLAALNAFEMMRRDADKPRSPENGETSDRLSRVMHTLMSVNIFEAVVSNLSFAFWPDNARAGMALLLAQHGAYDRELRHDVDAEWFNLYLSWNANFIWPSHYFSDMMCFTMLATPSIALRPPSDFCYNRAHSLFWVVRSAQLTRLRERRRQREQPSPTLLEPRCFHCRQLEPANDRQPLTSRTAVLTRAEGERLALSYGKDVSDGSGVWWKLALAVAPTQLANLARLYWLMPKSSPTKLELL